MIQIGQSKPVVPVSPRPFVELPGFCVRQCVTQRGIADVLCKNLNIFVITKVHHLAHEQFNHRLQTGVIANTRRTLRATSGPKKKSTGGWTRS